MCLTTGYVQICDADISAGVEKFYVARETDVASVTYSAGQVTNITMEAATYFWEFVPYEETSNYVEPVSRNQAAVAFTQTLTSVFQGRNLALRNVIQEMADCSCGFVVIHVENTGVQWVWGLRKNKGAGLSIGYPARLASGTEGNTGTTLEDTNTETVVLEAKSTAKAYELDSAFDPDSLLQP